MPTKYREEYLGDLLEYHNSLKTQGFSKSKVRIYLMVQIASILAASIWQKVVELYTLKKKVGK